MAREERFMSRRKYIPALSVIVGALACVGLFSQASYEVAHL